MISLVSERRARGTARTVIFWLLFQSQDLFGFFRVNLVMRLTVTLIISLAFNVCEDK